MRVEQQARVEQMRAPQQLLGRGARGEAVRKVPLHADKELRLDDGGPGYKIGTGFAILEKWDATRKGIKY